MNSLADSTSTTSLASGDTDDKGGMATNNTVMDSTNNLFTNNSQHDDLNSEFIQSILRKLQLEKSDYSFLKNILRVLESEQEQMIS